MSPLVTRTINDCRSAIREAKKKGQTLGLVPTMGALHEGHLSLIRAARKETGYVVVTIFVNPAQFGPNEDLAEYPRTFEQDLTACRAEGVDLVFAPSEDEMYPAGFCTFVEVHGMKDVLCGRSRPTHFRGVTTVVLKLFNIISPDIAYFGQKDAQQARLLQQMVNDLNLAVTLRVFPIIREADGLALSSRNQYLMENQRKNATALFASLCAARDAIERGERNAGAVQTLVQKRIEATPGARLDYAAVVDFATLQPADTLNGTVLVALAVYFGDTRLIDNVLIELE